MEAFADVVHSGKALYIGVSEWRAEEIRGGPRAGRASCSIRWSPTSRSTTCCGGSSRPRSCRPARSSASAQIVWSPIAQGVLTGKYKPGEAAPAGSRATDDEGRRRHHPALAQRRRARARAAAASRSPTRPACRWPSSRSPGSLQNPNVSSAIVGASRPEQVTDNVKAAGVKLDAGLMSRDRRGPRRRGGPRDPSRTASPPSRPSPWSWPLELAPGARPSRPAQSSGCRLIGPYSVLVSSSSETWSTPAASSARQFSPSQLSASPWLAKIAACRWR